MRMWAPPRVPRGSSSRRFATAPCGVKRGARRGPSGVDLKEPRRTLHLTNHNKAVAACAQGSAGVLKLCLIGRVFEVEIVGLALERLRNRLRLGGLADLARPQKPKGRKFGKTLQDQSGEATRNAPRIHGCRLLKCKNSPAGFLIQSGPDGRPIRNETVWPKTGKARTARRMSSCASLPPDRCCASNAIQRHDPGQTLKTPHIGQVFSSIDES